MNGNRLLNLPTSQLLKKFGAGSHKPGSGSAAALQGIISAHLIQTVISITKEFQHKVSSYKSAIPGFLIIEADIQDRILPNLEDLFEKDSVQFDRVINARRLRDDENDPVKKSKLAAECLQELKPATEIPLEIAKYCIELAGFSIQVFDTGFKSARGDSGVALNGAVAALAGCLSVVNLNLLSFSTSEWLEKVLKEVESLTQEQRRFSLEAEKRLDHLAWEVDQKKSLEFEVKALFTKTKGRKSLSINDIENFASEFQNLLWSHRNVVWKHGVKDGPLGVLKPDKALAILGFHFERVQALGAHVVDGELFEIAGLIDDEQKQVFVSEQFSEEAQKFTAAHELGHALFHEQKVLHRDRALDGSSKLSHRSLREIQADKFASSFLMPRKLVQRIFQSLFLSQKFVITNDTAFALSSQKMSELRLECGDLRGLSRKLAGTNTFSGTTFESISKRFGVSQETMAIRLEELGLVDF